MGEFHFTFIDISILTAPQCFVSLSNEKMIDWGTQSKSDMVHAMLIMIFDRLGVQEQFDMGLQIA